MRFHHGGWKRSKTLIVAVGQAMNGVEDITEIVAHLPPNYENAFIPARNLSRIGSTGRKAGSPHFKSNAVSVRSRLQKICKKAVVSKRAQALLPYERFADRVAPETFWSRTHVESQTQRPPAVKGDHH